MSNTILDDNVFIESLNIAKNKEEKDTKYEKDTKNNEQNKKYIKPLYLTDLNPEQSNDLCKELWGMVISIMIGEYTLRDVMFTGFYLDYNSNYKIDLETIINIPKTNQNLKEIFINTNIIPFDKKINWDVSKFIRPAMRNDVFRLNGQERFNKIINNLKSEPQHKFLDLYQTFFYPPLSVFGHDIDLCKKAKQILFSIEPSNFIKALVNDKINDMELGKEFFSLHMRLEDDWINNLVEKDETFNNRTFASVTFLLYNRITEAIDKLPKNGKIFIASELGRKMNKNNYLLIDLIKKYPGRITLFEETLILQEIFPLTQYCREIEDYIEFLICLKSKKCILNSRSIFAENLKYSFEILDKEYIEY